MKKVIEKIVELLIKLSGGVTIFIILLIIMFLFKEGSGLFYSPAIENGYILCTNSNNTVKKLHPRQIKKIFDLEIKNWKQLGGENEDIMIFRFDDIFSLYNEKEFGENYSLLPEKLGKIITKNKNIIAFLPKKYEPVDFLNVKKINIPTFSVKDFFFGTEWLPTATPSAQFGILPLLLGTLLVSVFAVLIALPLGLGVAVYLSELSNKRIRSLLKQAIELLAGIPSVVYGFFGLAVLSPLVQKVFNLDVGETAFMGGVILAIMALPTIITVSEDAIRNIPIRIKEASFALGGTHWQTIYRVIIPCASSGIIAASILGVGRALGETMAVLMVTGNAAVMPHSLFEAVRTIPATIAAELGETLIGGAHYRALFILACILFVLNIIINISAEIVIKTNVIKNRVNE